MNFDCIYFDSTALRDGDWPIGNLKLRNVVALAKQHDMKLFVPEPVEREMEEQWHREYCFARNKLENAISEFKRYCRCVAVEIKSPVYSSAKLLRANYANAVNDLKGQLGIENSPITLRPLKEVHELSVCRVPPFKDKDKHFQDAVNYLSVIDHLRSSSAKGVFVSGDQIFKVENFAGFGAGEKGVTIFESLENLEKALTTGLEFKKIEAYDKECEKMRAALETMYPQIEAYANQNVGFIPTDLTFLCKVVEFWGAKNPHITKVHLPWEKKIGEPFAFYFTVEFELQGIAESFAFGNPQPMNFGERPTRDALSELTELAARITRSPVKNKKNVNFSARATEMNGAFVDIKFEFAHVENWAAAFGGDAFGDALTRMLNRLEISKSTLQNP